MSATLKAQRLLKERSDEQTTSDLVAAIKAQRPFLKAQDWDNLAIYNQAIDWIIEEIDRRFDLETAEQIVEDCYTVADES